MPRTKGSAEYTGFIGTRCSQALEDRVIQLTIDQIKVEQKILNKANIIRTALDLGLKALEKLNKKKSTNENLTSSQLVD